MNECLKGKYDQGVMAGWSDLTIVSNLLKEDYGKGDVIKVVAMYSKNASDESDKAVFYARQLVKEVMMDLECVDMDVDAENLSILEAMVANVRAFSGVESMLNVEAYIRRTESLLKCPNRVDLGAGLHKGKVLFLEYQILMLDYLKQTGVRMIGFGADMFVAKRLYELGYVEREVVLAIALKSPRAVCASSEFGRGEYEVKVGRGARRGVVFEQCVS